MCDLCGEDPGSKYLRTRFETAYRDSTKTAVHDGHICPDCNEFEEGWAAQRAKKIDFHFVRDHNEAAELLLVDVHGKLRGGYQPATGPAIRTVPLPSGPVEHAVPG